MKQKTSNTVNCTSDQHVYKSDGISRDTLPSAPVPTPVSASGDSNINPVEQGIVLTKQQQRDISEHAIKDNNKTNK